MFFIGIFSSPLPYMAIFFIYLIGMINYTLHTKDKSKDMHAHDKTVQLKKGHEHVGEAFLTDEKTYFYDNFYEDRDVEQDIGDVQVTGYRAVFYSVMHSLNNARPRSLKVNDLHFIRPPPYCM